MAAVILASLDIAARPAEVAPARRWLCKLLDEEHPTITDDAVLMACEAITNSIRHSDSGSMDEKGEPGTVTLLVLTLGNALRIEIIDAGSQRNSPEMKDLGPDARSGRGLRMIDLLSEGRWGSYVHEDGRTVWFEVTP